MPPLRLPMLLVPARSRLGSVAYQQPTGVAFERIGKTQQFQVGADALPLLDFGDLMVKGVPLLVREPVADIGDPASERTQGQAQRLATQTDPFADKVLALMQGDTWRAARQVVSPSCYEVRVKWSS